MAERAKPDLRSIEPIGRAPDTDEPPTSPEVGRVGRAAAALSGTPPAVGADDEVVQPTMEPRTSPESEQELEQLRRG